MNIEAMRSEFEAWVSAAPFEGSINRHGDGAGFPGTYRDIKVDLAWCAFRHAKESALSEVERMQPNGLRVRLPAVAVQEKPAPVPISAVCRECLGKGYTPGVYGRQPCPLCAKQNPEAGHD